MTVGKKSIPGEPALCKDDSNYYEFEGKRYVRTTHAMSKLPKLWLDNWRSRVGDVEADRIMNETSRDGNIIHKMTEYHDKGETKKVKIMLTMYPWLLPYWLAWKVWVKERIERWVWIEKAVIHRELGVGGRLDRLGVVKGDPSTSVVDIKSVTSLDDNIGIQLYLYRSMALDTIDRLGLPLDLIPQRTIVAHMPGPRWETVNGVVVNKTEPDKVKVREYEWRKYQNDALDCVNEFLVLAR